MSELLKASEGVKSLSSEVEELEAVLSSKKKECNVFSESSRQALVKGCIEVVEPKLNEQLPKIKSIADSLLKLTAETGSIQIQADFKKLVGKIMDALESMVKYGADPEKRKASDMIKTLKGSLKGVER